MANASFGNTKPVITPFYGSSKRSPVKAMLATAQSPHRQDNLDTSEPANPASKQSQKSSKVLLDATRDFGCIQRPARDEIDQYKELFYQLIERIPATEKRLISAMLARGIFTPRPVALYLAQDKLEVAAPFLLYSPVLGDLDLRAIAKKKGGEHAAIIAKRRLPMDSHTVSTLHEVILGSSETTAAKPEVSTPELREIQVNKTVPAEPAKSGESYVPRLTGEEILALASVGGRLGRKDRKPAVEAPAPTIELAAQSAKPDFRLPKAETRKLMQLARLRDFDALSAYVEELCALESSATMKLIRAQQGTELVYLIKALGLASPDDIQLLLMLVPVTGRHISQYQAAKNLLVSLDPGICRMIFNEIGARFILNTELNPPVDRENIAAGFSHAIQRRRDSLEQQPRNQLAPAGRFTFTDSFLATG